MSPAYRDQLTIHELKQRAEQLHHLLKECVVCPRECRAHRTAGRIGVCRSTDRVLISQVGPHYGEEPPLVGWGGSGTIFFSRCTLWCLFCQNYDISHMDIGYEVSTSELTDAMLALQRRGCHNINLVTPTHFTPQIVEALVTAVQQGLMIPLVYNCGGYESLNTLRLLEGIVDVYMPDIKYSDSTNARRYSGVKNYWEVAREATREMHRQVGDLKLDANGIAQRGLLIRHLVLPNDLAGSKAILDFVAKEISRDAYINLMDQYHPAFKAADYPELNRRITSREFLEAVDYARHIGLHRGFLDE
jgi:putative pyruvate formate lyase activating enzyme